MKLNTFIPALAAIACIAPAFAGEGWLTDLDAAKKQAAQENKMIFMEFTGSDWCPPCKALKKDVLSTPEFMNEAKKNFVLVEFDFPRNKEQSPELKKKNQAEAEKYNIEGFPTIVFADAQGRPIKVAVGGRDKDSFMKEMAEAVKQGTELSAALKKAESAQGDAKIDALGTVLKMVPSEYAEGFYSGIEDELAKLDVNDKTGIKAARANEVKLEEQEQELGKFLSTVTQEKASDPAAMQASIADYAKKDGLLPETQQKVLFVVSQIMLEDGKIDEALAKMDEAEKLAPQSKLGAQIAQTKVAISANKDRILKMIEERKKAEKQKDASSK